MRSICVRRRSSATTNGLAAMDENCFRQADNTREYWDMSIEPEKWFDPAFQDFIDKEIMKQNNSSMK